MTEVFVDTLLGACTAVLLVWLATADFAMWGASQHTAHLFHVLHECSLVWLIPAALAPRLHEVERPAVLALYYCIFVLPTTAMLVCSTLDTVLGNRRFMHVEGTELFSHVGA